MSHNTGDPGTIRAMAERYSANQDGDGPFAAAREGLAMTNINNMIMNAIHRKPDPWRFPEWSLLLDADSYKVSMWKQYPAGTEYVSSYIESRGGRFPNTVLFGLQPFLRRLERPISRDEVEFANAFWTAHGEPFHYDGWMYIVNELGGKLPIRIEALEEGQVVPVQNALVQVVNTDPKCFWLTTWVETALLRAVWYPTTVATLSWSIKQLIRRYLDMTCDNPEAEIGFKLHDFGSRGVSSHESAMIGGAAHLLNFNGTDTAVGMIVPILHYNAPFDPTAGVIPGYSIPAAEHSTITSWGREHEVNAFENMLDQFAGPGKIVAVVSDSYDIYKATEEYWGGQLRDIVKNNGGTVVIRPDSGDPTVVPVEIVRMLGLRFGYTVNKKGYKVLPSCVRVIQGDGINYDSIRTILENLKLYGWSAENVAFGMGGALLQGVNRDTMKWAMKASAIKIAGSRRWRDVYKDPVTDTGKRSKRGRQAVIITGWDEVHLGRSVSYETILLDDLEDGHKNLLRPVFQDGEVLRLMSWDAVKKNTEEHYGVVTKIPRAA